MIGSIPSPHSGTLDLGPFVLHMYGLMLLLAIAAAVALTGVRYVRRGGDWDVVLRVAVWGVAAGIVGARLYHDVTSWNEVPDPKWKGVFEVWKGGLGVWGGILFGSIAGAIVVKRSGRSVTEFMDVVAPGLFVAQGIGRLGNWWNQELYGKPTDLPWGLKIDVQHRVAGYEGSSTFHPTFLYEFVYDLTMAGVLILIGWRFRIKLPGLFALYVALYTFGRFFEELLRIDPSHKFGGLRLNAWVSLVLFLGSTVFFVWWQFFRREGPRAEGETRKPSGPKMAIPKGRRVRPGQ